MTTNNVPWTALIGALPFDPWPKILPRTADGPVRPMAVGMSDDLALRLDESRWPSLRRALSRYCASTSYISALAADGAQRHDIDGNPVGPVSEADRLSASVWLLSRSLDRVAKADIPTKAKADIPTKAKVAAEAKALVERAQAVRVGQGGRPILSLKKAAG